MTDTMSHITQVLESLSTMGHTIDEKVDISQKIYDNMTKKKENYEQSKCKSWVWSGKNGIIPHTCKFNCIDGSDFCKKHGAEYGDCKFCGGEHQYYWQLLGRCDRTSWRDFDGCPELKRRCYGTKKLIVNKKEKKEEKKKEVVTTEKTEEKKKESLTTEKTEEKKKESLTTKKYKEKKINNVVMAEEKKEEKKGEKKEVVMAEEKKEEKKEKKEEKKEKEKLIKKEEMEKSADDEVVSLTDISQIMDGNNEKIKLSEKDMERIERGRKYLETKHDKKEKLKQQTEKAKAGQVKSERHKINDEDHQLMELDEIKVYVDTSDEQDDDKFTAYEFVEIGFYGKKVGIYNADTEVIE
tara:strand:+ start:3013 stop:4071 length:1059 start_codon:yes stop_codon:yes gene_type:complete